MFTKEAQTAWHKQLNHIFLVVLFVIYPQRYTFFGKNGIFSLKYFARMIFLVTFAAVKQKIS
jgi:hypothetical protein